MPRPLTTAVLLGLLAAPLGAQHPSPPVSIRWGSEVRVYAQSWYAAGRVVDLSSTTIVVADRDGNADTLLRSEILQVQLREGDRWIAISAEQLPTVCTVPAGPPVAPGVHMRITDAHGPIVGTLTEWRGDTVFLADADSTLRAVPIGPHTRVQVSAGRHGAGLEGFVIGFVLGATGGAAGGTAICEGFANIGFGSSHGNHCGRATAEGAAIGGVAFGALGGLIGSGVRSERWADVPADSVRSYLATLAMARGGR